MGLIQSSNHHGTSSPSPKINTMVRSKALSIGINYYHSDNELSGCVNDSDAMKKLFLELGYPEDRILILNDRDYQPDSENYPSRENILRAMYWLTTDMSTEDYHRFHEDIHQNTTTLPLDHRCFLHYSGHGSQSREINLREEDHHDEVIVPVDFQTAGLIKDDTLHEILNRLPPGTGLQALMDCCNSGTNLDLPYVFQSGRVRYDNNNYETNAWFQQFSAVTDSQSAIDLGSENPAGAMTSAFLSVMKDEKYQGSVDDLVQKMNRKVTKLAGSGKHDVCYSAGKYFSIGDKIKL